MHYEHVEILHFGADTLVRELMRPLEGILKRPGVTELVINKPLQVRTEEGAEWVKHDVPELTLDLLEQLAGAIATYTDQEISKKKPIMSAKLPDDERIQIVAAPAVEPGTISYTIRVPSPDIRPLEKYEAEGTFSRYVWAEPDYLQKRWSDLEQEDRQLVSALKERKLRQFLEMAVRMRKNIAVVGDTGSGKTTLMKSMAQVIPAHERLITIEDVRELFLPDHDNCVHLKYSKGGQGVAQVTPSDLIASCMRMKPDRVLMAELRGGEAFDFLKLMTTGHRGSLTSWHAESCTLAQERYVFMCKENEQASIYDADALKKLVRLTIDITIHVVAKVVYDDQGNALRKERYVSEVQFDPAGKLLAQYGNAVLHHGGDQ